MVQTFFHTTNRDDKAETEILIEYTFRGGWVAQTYGPADLCWPAEAAEVEIINAWLSCSRDVDGKKIPVTLTDAEGEKIAQWLVENHEDPGRDDYGP